ncbi:hypothetical protein NDU88_004790 [Pleurodeles waltl]|uniref:Uncharacterized protein n=1 Tax=Pleurodeles waltl TaxID=8319 RepID=A0AAV7T948_PLEWA|nr:hypothetical protein NDU88_004790 [Pleurodeles waltl]
MQEVETSDSKIAAALARLKNAKVLGPSGLRAHIVPHLGEMFHSARQEGVLPEDLRHALIIRIYKEGKPPEDCASHRPILWQNIEAKMLVVVLANHMLHDLGLIVEPIRVHAEQGDATVSDGCLAAGSGSHWCSYHWMQKRCLTPI